MFLITKRKQKNKDIRIIDHVFIRSQNYLNKVKNSSPENASLKKRSALQKKFI